MKDKRMELVSSGELSGIIKVFKNIGWFLFIVIGTIIGFILGWME